MDTDGESSVLPGLRTRICCIWGWMWKLYTLYIIPSLEHITRKLPETAYSGSAEWLLIIPIEESTNQKTEKLPDSNRSGEISSKYRKLNSVLYADFSFLPDRTSPSRPNLILKFCPGLLLTTLQAHVRIMQLSGLTKSPLERHHWRQQRVESWKEYYQENVGGKLLFCCVGSSLDKGRFV